MIKDNPGSDRCRFCHSQFSVEILGKIEDDKEDVYCEICGDIIKRVNDRYNFNPPNIPENESKTNIKDKPAKLPKELEPNPDALHYPIGRVFYDTDFPLTFKSNFIIVFSRLICYSVVNIRHSKITWSRTISGLLVISLSTAIHNSANRVIRISINQETTTYHRE